MTNATKYATMAYIIVAANVMKVTGAAAAKTVRIHIYLLCLIT
jgi:hypothetical protein